MSTNTPGASRTLSIIKLCGVIHRSMDENDKPRCVYCGLSVVFKEDDPEHTGTIDHVYGEKSKKLRKSQISYNDPRNLVVACRICNAVKGDALKDDGTETEEEEEQAWDYFEDYLKNKGVNCKKMIKILEGQMATPIDDAWAHYWAGELYPNRRDYNLNASRMRGLRKRHGSNAEKVAEELDKKKALREADKDDAPF